MSDHTILDAAIAAMKIDTGGSDHTILDAAIAALNIDYRAVFVPLSESRNAGRKLPTVNWRVYLKRAGATLDTDYSQGTAHIYKILPDKVSPHCVMGDEILRAAAESGRRGGVLGNRALPAPELRDVLYSLVLDADALDAGCFEDWASENGYDTDSRAGERIYNTCVALGLKLRRLIGDAAIATLREAFQDY